MPAVRVNVAQAEHLEGEYNRAATTIDTTIGDLSALLAEANWLLETRSSPLYGPLPSLKETASGLHNERDDLTWRVDYLQSTDGHYLRGLDMLSGYTSTIMPDGYLDEPNYSEALAAFRRAEAQSWTERTPLEQADHSLDQIRTILDTTKHDRGRGVGATVADGIWSTEDLEVVIENEHGYYTPAQQRHAQTVLTMATSSPEARDHLGITQSDDGWSLADIGHLTLDVFGMVPAVGNVADGINASWYAAEGEFLDAALSSMALIPGLGQVVTPLRNAIRTATDGRVFRSLREAMEWIRRWLDEAGIWRFTDETVRGADSAVNVVHHERYLTQLRSEMDRPIVTDPDLDSLFGRLWRPNAQIGNGSTAAAVRYEIANQGAAVGGRNHIQKAQDSIVSLERWIAANPLADINDRAAAENVLLDLRDSLRTGT